MTKNVSEWSAVDESFDPTLSKSYYLSIRIAADGLSFCILDPVRNQFIQFKTCRLTNIDKWQSLLNFIDNEPLFRFEYQKVVLIVENRFSTLVPMGIYQADKIEILFKATFSEDLTDFVLLENKIKMVGAVNVFALPEVLYTKLKAVFGNVVFLHATTPLLESKMIDTTIESKQVSIHLHFERELFYVMVVDNRNLKLFNFFELTGPNDMVYFLLFVVDQLKLNARETEIELSGKINRDGEYHRILRSYFKQVQFDKPNRYITFSPVLREVDLSRYIQLFNFSICV